MELSSCITDQHQYTEATWVSAGHTLKFQFVFAPYGTLACRIHRFVRFTFKCFCKVVRVRKRPNNPENVKKKVQEC